MKLLVAKFADLLIESKLLTGFGDHEHLDFTEQRLVALSNFISAYHKPAGTVGGHRQLLSVNDYCAATVQDTKLTLSRSRCLCPRHQAVVGTFLRLSASRKNSIEGITDALLGNDSMSL